MDTKSFEEEAQARSVIEIKDGIQNDSFPLYLLLATKDGSCYEYRCDVD